MRTFKDFYNNKIRKTIDQLNTIAKICDRGGLRVESYLNEYFTIDPYIYVYNPNKDTSFAGIRIYKIGDTIAYRVQRESKTHPYGSAYSLDINLMFDDLLENGEVKDKDLAEEVISMVIDQLKRFFQESAKAENETNEKEKMANRDTLGKISVRNPIGGDYSSMVSGH